MGILDVIDRVLVGLSLGHFQIEIELAVRSAHQEIVAGGVLADLVDHLPQGHVLARPGGHGHGLAVAQQAHELHEDDPEGVPVAAEGLDAGLQPRDVAVMVGPPDIDDRVEAPVELVLVIGDVRREIGGRPRVPDDDTVLLVAEGRRAEPERAAFPVHMALFPQMLEELHDAVVLVQPPLAEVVVEEDAEGRQIVLDPLHDGAGGVGREKRQDLFLGPVPVPISVPREDLPRQLGNVVPLVVIRREFDRLAERLAVAKVNRASEGPHLVAHVVDVVFLDDAVAAHPQDVGDDVARDGPPCMPDVKRARGVGAHELDLDLPALSCGEGAVAFLQALDLQELAAPAFLPDEEVDEAGARDFDPAQQFPVVLQFRDDRLGDRAGVLAGLGGDHHGHVRGVVPVRLVARHFQLDEGKALHLEESLGEALCR